MMDASNDLRFKMWSLLIPGYAGMDKIRKKTFKLDYCAMHGIPEPSNVQWTKAGDIYFDDEHGLSCYIPGANVYKDMSMVKAQTPIPLDCCEAIPTPMTDKLRALYNENKKEQETKEHNMYATPSINISTQSASVVDPNQETRQYLRDRVYGEYHEKKKAARLQFHMDDDKTPDSPKELVDRIKEGAFKFHENSTTKADGSWVHKNYSDYGYNLLGQIDWRTVEADIKGYEAWKIKAKNSRQVALDKIATLAAAEGLAALQEFINAS